MYESERGTRRRGISKWISKLNMNINVRQSSEKPLTAFKLNLMFSISCQKSLGRNWPKAKAKWGQQQAGKQFGAA